MTSSVGPSGASLRVGTTVKESALWIFLEGEVDASSLEHLDAALNGVALDGHQSVCLDLSGLNFIDVRALRRLTTFAMQAKEHDCGVTTLGTSEPLRQAVRTLGGQDQLGLT